jgi:thioredoxin 1
MSTLRTISERNFAAEVLGTHGAVIIHFRTARCAACRRVDAALRSLATESHPPVKIARVDVRRCPSLARRLGIVMVPTLIGFVEGVERLRMRGAVSLDELSRAVRGLLEGAAPVIDKRAPD